MARRARESPFEMINVEESLYIMRAIVAKLSIGSMSPAKCTEEIRIEYDSYINFVMTTFIELVMLMLYVELKTSYKKHTVRMLCVIEPGKCAKQKNWIDWIRTISYNLYYL